MARARKLIVYGNCQAGAVAVILGRVPQLAADWTIIVHDLWKTGEELARQVADFDEAGLFFLQDVRNWRSHPLRDRLPPGLKVVRFPYVYVAALWPFDCALGGVDRAMLQAMQSGRHPPPFPFGFQDAVLARLRDEIADPAERLRRYRALAFDGVPDLRRYAELEEARLLKDDRKFGLSIGRFVVDHYRDIRLFHAIAHPTTALIGRLAQELLAKAGVPMAPDEVPGLAHDYMADYQVPVHPEVIRALGLRWVTPESRYQQPSGQAETFDAYFDKYVRFPVEAAAAAHG